MAQYKQRVDESTYVDRPQLVPGLRGRARSFHHYPDYLTQASYWPQPMINGGYNFHYVPARTRSYTPAMQSVFVTKSAPAIKPYRFKSQPIRELNVRQSVG